MIRKIMLVTIVLLAILASAFLLMAVFNPDYDETVVTEVNAPANKSFAILNDTSYAKQWMEGLVNIELIEGEDHKPGAKYRLTFNNKGKEFSMIETVTDYVDNERFSFDLDQEFGKYHTDIFVEEKDGKTYITEHMFGTPTGLFAQGMVALMKGSIRTDKKNWYNKLARLIEETEWEPEQIETIAPDTIEVQ